MKKKSEIIGRNARICIMFICLVCGIICGNMSYIPMDMTWNLEIGSVYSLGRAAFKSIIYYIPLLLLGRFGIGLFVIPLYIAFRGIIYSYTMMTLLTASNAIIGKTALPLIVQFCGLLYFSSYAYRCAYMKLRLNKHNKSELYDFRKVLLYLLVFIIVQIGVEYIVSLM